MFLNIIIPRFKSSIGISTCRASAGSVFCALCQAAGEHVQDKPEEERHNPSRRRKKHQDPPCRNIPENCLKHIYNHSICGQKAVYNKYIRTFFVFTSNLPYLCHLDRQNICSDNKRNTKLINNEKASFNSRHSLGSADRHRL